MGVKQRNGQNNSWFPMTVSTGDDQPSSFVLRGLWIVRQSRKKTQLINWIDLFFKEIQCRIDKSVIAIEKNISPIVVLYYFTVPWKSVITGYCGYVVEKLLRTYLKLGLLRIKEQFIGTSTALERYVAPTVLFSPFFFVYSVWCERCTRSMYLCLLKFSHNGGEN